MSPSPIHSVPIIGAGISGLVLAQALKKKNIPSTIYEKATADSRHNYGITLHRPSYLLLCRLLDIEEADLRKRIAVDSIAGGTGKVRGSSNPGSPADSSLRANRGRLEHLLQQDLDIRHEHTVSSLEEAPSGVTLHFRDGSRAHGTRVVGGDGPHSITRSHVLPGKELEILPFAVYTGKRYISRPMFDKTLAPALEGGNVIETRTANGVLLNISVNDIREDRVSISWIYSRRARGADGEDALFRPGRGKDEAGQVPEEFFEELRGLGDVGSPFKDVLDEERVRGDRILNWLMRTVRVGVEELGKVGSGRAYLMGDAVHAEPIIGGEGANRAIEDGIELAEYIAASGESGSASEWYQARVPVWERSVQNSEQTIARKHQEQRAIL